MYGGGPKIISTCPSPKPAAPPPAPPSLPPASPPAMPPRRVHIRPRREKHPHDLHPIPRRRQMQRRIPRINPMTNPLRIHPRLLNKATDERSIPLQQRRHPPPIILQYRLQQFRHNDQFVVRQRPDPS